VRACTIASSSAARCAATDSACGSPRSRWMRTLLEIRLQAIARRGVPNAFGPQRFGREQGNLRLARLVCRRLCAAARRAWLRVIGGALADLQRRACRAHRRRHWECAAAGEPVGLDGSGSWFIAVAGRLAACRAPRRARRASHRSPVGPGRAAGLRSRRKRWNETSQHASRSSPQGLLRPASSRSAARCACACASCSGNSAPTRWRSPSACPPAPTPRRSCASSSTWIDRRGTD
jgi:hypothetical protein